MKNNFLKLTMLLLFSAYFLTGCLNSAVVNNKNKINDLGKIIAPFNKISLSLKVSGVVPGGTGHAYVHCLQRSDSKLIFLGSAPLNEKSEYQFSTNTLPDNCRRASLADRSANYRLVVASNNKYQPVLTQKNLECLADGYSQATCLASDTRTKLSTTNESGYTNFPGSPAAINILFVQIGGTFSACVVDKLGKLLDPNCVGGIIDNNIYY